MLSQKSEKSSKNFRLVAEKKQINIDRNFDYLKMKVKKILLGHHLSQSKVFDNKLRFEIDSLNQER